MKKMKKSNLIIIILVVIVVVLGFLFFRNSLKLSPLNANCEYVPFSVTQEERDFYGWDTDKEPKLGDNVIGCTNPSPLCLDRHNKKQNDNTFYHVTWNKDRKVWEITCEICEGNSLICSCKPKP